VGELKNDLKQRRSPTTTHTNLQKIWKIRTQNNWNWKQSETEHTHTEKKISKEKLSNSLDKRVNLLKKWMGNYPQKKEIYVMVQSDHKSMLHINKQSGVM
jgi:TRAP-type mannitol/chloroaromatic compound transport system substrate-binding protein